MISYASNSEKSKLQRTLPCEDDVLKRLSDHDAREMMERVCGTSAVARFQAIPPAKRDVFLTELHEQGISIRQLAGLTGISVAPVRKVM